MTNILIFDTKYLSRYLLTFTAVGLLAVTVARAETTSFDQALLDIQHRWAQANYDETGRSQKKAFDALLDDARVFATNNPDRAEALVWQGIVASSYAGVKGPFGAMSLAKEARDSLRAAEAKDPAVLDGSVYTSLGTLYAKVPGGIIGFGDDDIARDYLKKALRLNPDGIDPNYFYAEFLIEHDEFDAAKKALLKAQKASPRADRPLADEGRHREIDALLVKVNQQIDRQS